MTETITLVKKDRCGTLIYGRTRQELSLIDEVPNHCLSAFKIKKSLDFVRRKFLVPRFLLRSLFR